MIPMQLLIKHLSLFLATLLLMSIVSVSVADPTDEMRSLVVTADYHPVNVNKASASEIAEALRGWVIKLPLPLWLSAKPTALLKRLKI